MLLLHDATSNNPSETQLMMPMFRQAVHSVLSIQTLSACTAVLIGLISNSAYADRIKNPTAVLSGLDKITGRIITFEVAIDETVQFGSLQLTPKICWTRPATEAPNTTGFFEIDEVTVNNDYRRIFTGWMFASSPGLNAVEHAVYDVWLADCKGGTEIIVDAKTSAVDPLAPPDKSDARARRQPAQQPRRAPNQDRLDVVPQQGVPVQPTQQPSRSFFPTNPSPSQPRAPLQVGPDPAGGSNR
jgi:hypothetical protein